jgi:FKBP-type peptidyl-prolyl cis-trans isomerase 2
MRRCILAITILCVLMLSAIIVRGEDNKVSDGNTVKFNYVLWVNEEITDSTIGKDPLEYTHGQNMIVPGLEKEMEGMKAGDVKIINVAAKDGYGEADKDAIFEFPKSQFGGNLDPQVGMILQMRNEFGQASPAKVVEVKENTIILDFNHPLAGKDLKFEIEIVDVN